MTLVDFGAGFDVDAVEVRDARIGLTVDRGVSRLEIRTGHAIPWPGITLKPEGKAWDVSGYQQVLMDVTNTGDGTAAVGMRVDNPGADGVRNCVSLIRELAPGESQTFIANLVTTPWVFDEPLELVGMRAAPGVPMIDPTNVNQIIVFVRQPKEDLHFTIGDIRLQGKAEPIKAAGFLPFIDEFGQFIHDDWPGKTHSLEDLVSRQREEDAGRFRRPRAHGRVYWYLAEPLCADPRAVSDGDHESSGQQASEDAACGDGGRGRAGLGRACRHGDGHRVWAGDPRRPQGGR